MPPRRTRTYLNGLPPSLPASLPPLYGRHARFVALVFTIKTCLVPRYTTLPCNVQLLKRPWSQAYFTLLSSFRVGTCLPWMFVHIGHGVRSVPPCLGQLSPWKNATRYTTKQEWPCTILYCRAAPSERGDRGGTGRPRLGVRESVEERGVSQRADQRRDRGQGLQ